jgi:hypothetical protein
MGFEDLREFLVGPTLQMPIGGRVYTVRSATARVWLELSEFAGKVADAQTAGVPLVDDWNELDLYKRALGDDTYQELVDTVSVAELKHAGLTAYFWQLGQEETVKAMWTAPGKAAPPKAASTSTSTGGATTTKRRASTKGTTSRKR